jgi:hypothetical protein
MAEARRAQARRERQKRIDAVLRKANKP